MGFRAFGPVGTMASVLPTVIMVASTMQAPAQALAAPAELSTWSYDEATQLLEFSLPQSVLPRFFLLAEPTRIVLDIPATQLGAGPTAQTYDGVVQRIRVSQFEGDTVRLVIDLAPGTVLQERQADIEFDDSANGQRHWRFHPRVDTAGAIAPAPLVPSLTPPAPTAPATAGLPSPPPPAAQDRTNTPLADVPVSLENAEEISYSAAGLELPERPTGLEALPVDLYAESNRTATADTVTVPPLATVPPADTVATRPAPPEPDTAVIDVPLLVAPTLESPDQAAAETISPGADTPPAETASSVPLPTVESAVPLAGGTESPTLADEGPTASSAAAPGSGPVLPPLRDAAPTAGVTPSAAAAATTPPGVPDGAAADAPETVTSALPPAPERPAPGPTPEAVPPFVEPDTAVAAEASQYTAALVPLETLPVDAAPEATPEASSPGADAPIHLIEMGETARTITPTGVPTVVQFGQPLP